MYFSLSPLISLRAILVFSNLPEFLHNISTGFNSHEVSSLNSLALFSQNLLSENPWDCLLFQITCFQNPLLLAVTETIFVSACLQTFYWLRFSLVVQPPTEALFAYL